MMKIICTKSDLVYGVHTVQRAVSTKNTMPILDGILIEANNDKIIFKATNLEIGIICSINAETIETGSIVLPSRYFGELVKKLPDIPIHIETNENHTANITYGESSTSINGYDPEEFPVLPHISSNKLIKIPGDLFKNMVKQVVIAISRDEARPIFTGILTDIGTNGVKLIGTDTHRLAYRSNTIQTKLEMKEIIPGKTLAEVSKLIENEEPVSISFDQNQVLFQTENISIISRIINGQFPDYNQVIPSNYTTNVRIDTKAFLQALERASLLVRENSQDKANVIKLSISGNHLTINSNAPDVGKLHEKIPAFIEGEDIKISFNSRYLLDVLKVIEDEEIYLQLTGSLSPGIIKPVNQDNYLHLILPIRTV